MKLTFTLQHIFWPALILLIHASCVEPYTPPVTKDESNLLVVEGYINTNTNSVQVKLSRSVALSKKQTFPAELKAILALESEDGVKIPLVEKTGGIYEKTGLTLNPLMKYRLRITTKGVPYSSDLIGLNPAPVLDTVAWKTDDKGTTIYANAHDPTGLIKFYKWNYSETWQYHSAYGATYKVVDGNAIALTPAEDMYTCWTTLPAPNLLLASTSHLTENIVHEFPLIYLPLGSIKLSVKYSMLVNLRGVDETEYNYWQQIQKTTENIGGLYDPLPAQVLGNLHNDVNPAEKVLGYFSGGGIREKRMYVSIYDLPQNLRQVTRDYCVTDTITVRDLKIFGNGMFLISALISPNGPNIIGYLYSSRECMDCRLAGGVTAKPPFWP